MDDGEIKKKRWQECYQKWMQLQYDQYNILMNPYSIFHPYWSFINTQNIFPFLQIPSFESYLYPASNILVNKTIQENIVSQKKSSQSEKQLILPERNIVDKKKIIKKVKEDENFSYRYQDKDRNIYSNILKGFVTKFRQDFNFQVKCQEYNKITNCQFKLEDFIQFVNQNFQKSKSYISPAYMKKVLKDNEGKQISKYFSLLLSKYLREGFTLVLLGSPRIQKQSKILQMKKARELWGLVFQKEVENYQKSSDQQEKK